MLEPTFVWIALGIAGLFAVIRNAMIEASHVVGTDKSREHTEQPEAAYAVSGNGS